VPIGVPPLRERKSDIPALAAHFIRKYSQEFKKDVRGLSRGALLALDGYDWPGNVRELENIIERSVALATRPVIGLDDLPLDLAMNEVAPGRCEGEAPLTLKDARDRFEQAYVLRALEREDWNQSRAARGLGVHRNTLIARLTAWGFRRGEPGISVRPAAGGSDPA
jgi:DNA-binding NtrC family response regulator